MAEPTDVGNDLLSKIRQFNQIKSDTVRKATAALPISMQAARAGGSPWAAAQSVMRPKPTTAKVDPIESAKLKQSILKDLVAAKAKAAEEQIDAAKALRSAVTGNSRSKTALELAIDYATKAGNINAGEAQALRDDVMGVHKDALDKTIKNMLGGGGDAPGASERGQQILQQMGYDEIVSAGTNSDDYWAKVNQILAYQSTTGGPEAQRSFLALLGSSDPIAWKQNLEDAVQAGSATAKMVLDKYSAIGSDIESKKKEIADTIDNFESTSLQALKGIRGGVSLESVMKAAKEFQDLMDGKSPDTPEAMQGVADKIIGLSNGLDPAQDPVMQQRYNDLLAKLDAPDESLPSNLREAKQRIMNDPSFKAWMAKNGFSDPATAFKELRRRSDQQIYANKVNDKKIIAANRLEQGTKMVAPKQPSTAAAASKTSSEGTATTASDAELVKLSESLLADERAKPSTPEAVPAAEQVPESEPPPPQPEVPPPPAAPPPKLGNGVGPLAAQAGHALSHPFASVNNATSEIARRIRDAQKRRKEDGLVTDEEEEQP